MSARPPVALALLVLTLGAAAPASHAQALPQLAPGRVAELDGELLLLPAGWDDWRTAERNSAVAPGDWLRTGRGDTALLELAPSVLVRLGPWTEVRVDRQRDVLVVELLEGRLAACSSFGAEGLSVVSRDGTAWLEPGGFYGVEVEGGRTTVAVSSGLAEAETGGGLRRVTPGRLAELERGARKPKLRRLSGRGWDSFDREAHETCRALLGDDADLRLVGASALQRHGEWVMIGGLRYWRPFGVHAGWRPYGDGCFRWHPSWGWYFVPHASWGWVTHHHGGWSWFADWGWVWYPDSWWYPHRVSFVVRDRSVYWCPRPWRPRHDRHDRHDRDDRDDRDDRRPHDGAGPAAGPGAGWSEAPLEDFAEHPVVRARPPVPGVELPRIAPLDDDRRGLGQAPPERELLRPPLPPRAREPLLGPAQPLAPTPALRRELPRAEASPASTDRLERPGRARPAAPIAVRPGVPGLTDRSPRIPAARDEQPPRPGRIAPPLPGQARPIEGSPVPERPGVREPAERPAADAPPAPRERLDLPSPRLRPSPGVLKDRERELERRQPRIDTERSSPFPQRPDPWAREIPRPAPERRQPEPAPSVRERARPTPAPPVPETPPAPTPRVREVPRPTPPPEVRETPPPPPPAPRVRERPRPTPPPAPRPERPAPRKRGDEGDDKR